MRYLLYLLLGVGTLTTRAQTQEPTVSKLEDASLVDMLNSIDYFKQYHNQGFKVNVFRKRSPRDSSLDGFKDVTYYFAMVVYSNPKKLHLFEVGSFFNPQILEVKRRGNNLTLTVEHGKETLAMTYLKISPEGIFRVKKGQ